MNNEPYFCDKQTAEKRFNDGIKIYIGYQNRDGGAFWSSEQYPKCNTFESLVKQVKELIPHTRIKYMTIQ